MLKNSVVFIIIAIVFNSCSKFRNEIITTQNIEKGHKEILKKSDLDRNSKAFWEGLYQLYLGRNVYLKWFHAQVMINNETLSELTVEDINSMLVNEEDYEFIVEKIFTYLVANKITYKMLHNELIASNKAYDNYEEKLQKNYAELEPLYEECKNKYAKTGDQTCYDSLAVHPLGITIKNIEKERDFYIEKNFPNITQIRQIESDLFKF